MLVAWLSELGLKTTYITEAQIDLLMLGIGKVMVGADAVLADGSIIIKIVFPPPLVFPPAPLCLLHDQAVLSHV